MTQDTKNKLQTGEMTVAERLSAFAADTDFGTLPEDVIYYSKRFIMDVVGCILGGKTEKSSQIIAEVVRSWGGHPESTVIGYDFKTSCANAALANGTIGHALELDDDHRVGTQHPAVQTFPTVLAVGERVRASGEECITAFAIGCESAIRIGMGFLGDLYYQGFHPTGVCGVFGSALAAGKLLKLNREQLTNALGIAGSQASGLREWKTTGAWSKRLQAGHPNFGGVLSALLAQGGFTGPRTVIDGTYGLMESYSYQKHYSLIPIIDQLGIRYEMKDTSIKPHACCRFAQPIVDCTLALVFKYDLKPEDVAKVVVGTGKNTLKALTEPAERKYRPKTRPDAQFSLPYSVAVSIFKRRALEKEYNEECYTDPEILALADKVTAYLDEEVESKWPEYYPAIVTIETVDGRKLTEKIDYPKGDPENPVTDDELEYKFRNLASYTLKEDRINKLVDTLWNLEKVQDIRELGALLSLE